MFHVRSHRPCEPSHNVRCPICIWVPHAESERCWCECIRLWSITLDHKKYEEAIQAVQQSYRRSQLVRERKRLKLEHDPSSTAPPASGSSVCPPASAGPNAKRLPKRFSMLDAAGADLPSALALGSSASGLKRAAQKQQEDKAGDEQGVGSERQHLPPATYDPEQFTLLKMWVPWLACMAGPWTWPEPFTMLVEACSDVCSLRKRCLASEVPLCTAPSRQHPPAHSKV